MFGRLGSARLTHHPRQLDLPLTAGEGLRKGDFCWINEDATVWRSWADASGALFDGMAAADYSVGAPVTLIPATTLYVVTSAADVDTPVGRGWRVVLEFEEG